MRFRVLGPLEVWDGEVRCDLGDVRQRSLLAVLLLHRNEILSADEISAALMRVESRVHDEMATLRELVGEALVIRPWGYGLRAPAGSVDADEFEALVKRAEGEVAEAAMETLSEALALWHGPAFADVAEPFAQIEITRLEDERNAAQTKLHELLTGAHKSVGTVPIEPRRKRFRKRTSWSRPSLALPLGSKLVAGAAIVAAAAIAVIWGLRSGEPRTAATGPNMVAALDPRANRIVDSFTVGSVPSTLAVGSSDVWVYNSNDRNISLIDPRTRLVRTISTECPSSLKCGGGEVTAFAVGANAAWVGNGWMGTVSRIDPESGEVARTIRLPGKRYTAAALIATSPSDIWITGVTLAANAPSPFKPVPDPPPAHFPPPLFRAWRIDPRTNAVTRMISLERVANFGLRTVLINGDSVLVRGDYGLVRIDRRTGRVEHRLALPSRGCCESAGLAIGGGSLWVVGIARSVLWRLDGRTFARTATIPLRGQPESVAFGADAVWVADGTGGILKVDPETNRVVKRIPITGVPKSLAFGLGRLWVALD